MDNHSPSRRYLIIIIAILFIVFFAKVVEQIMWLKVRSISMGSLSMGSLSTVLLIGGALCFFLWVSFICFGIYSYSDQKLQRFTMEENKRYNLKIIVAGVLSFVMMILFFMGFGLEMVRENGFIQELIYQEINNGINHEIVGDVMTSFIEFSPLGIGLLMGIGICFFLLIGCIGFGIYSSIQKRKDISSTRSGIRTLISGIVFFTLMVGCSIGFGVEFIRANDWLSEMINQQIPDDILTNRELTLASHEMHTGNSSFWNLEIIYAVGGYENQHILEIQDTEQLLYIDADIEDGELYLQLIQGGIQTTLDISDLDQELEYSLKNFEEGELTLILESSGLRRAMIDIYIE